MTNKHLLISLVVLIGVLILAGLAGFSLYSTSQLQPGDNNGLNSLPVLQTSTSTVNPTDARIEAAYAVVESKEVLSQGNTDLLNALATFRDVAADTNNTNFQRAQALNGINYAYTQSNFDATDVYDVVFSQPPFSSYYTASTTEAVDPLRPASGSNAAAVEAALVNLNELSNSLTPNHYAISRMEVADVFAFQRIVAQSPASQKTQLQQTYAAKMKDLIAAFNALPSLSSIQTYSPPMRLQIMFVHASALAFVGRTFKDQTYLDEGESAFQDTIDLAGTYSPTDAYFNLTLNQSLLARIEYASYYWNEYQQTDPQRIEAVLQPLTDVATVKDTAVYTNYLPSIKNMQVAPASVLRTVAAQMPTLKTFLQGEGWTF